MINSDMSKWFFVYVKSKYDPQLGRYVDASEYGLKYFVVPVRARIQTRVSFKRRAR